MSNRHENPVPTDVEMTRAEAFLFPWLVLMCVLTILLVIGARCAAGSVVTDDYLSAVEQVESGGDGRAVGDGGLSRGSFQFQLAAWQDVNDWRADHSLRRVSFNPFAHDRATARQFAFRYLTILESSLASANGVQPTKEQLFAAWNLGLEGFRRRGFLLSRCPVVTQRGAQSVSALVGATSASKRRSLSSPRPQRSQR